MSELDAITALAEANESVKGQVRFDPPPESKRAAGQKGLN
jgi:hypothetical protein